ncbi:baseplate J/gp47 family protein, partial [Phascolarctobacterium sp.]|uniref:baseplate J/gp47 family protein n=1 Tax=Phascolarctobacterium sp. TaxID=2049039 RepID=UPI003869BD16
YELLENIYYSRFPNTARGVSLDRLCPYIGISRNPATYAAHKIRFIGVAGEYVPEAFEVSTTDGTLVYHTYERYLIGEDGTVEGVVYCETAGTAGNVGTGKIDTIVNPDVNVESIVHLGIEEYADAIETDISLRKRWSNTISGAGSDSIAAIKAAIMQVPSVKGAEVVENDTDDTKDGIPPHCFKCYVLAPETQDALVANAIFSKKPIGVRAVGDVSVEFVDNNGVTRTIAFSRTVEKTLYIKMSITKNQYFEADGVEQIQTAIAEYINNLVNGEDVYLSSIYGYIYKAAGVVNVSSLEMSTNGSTYSAGNISVGVGEVARIDTANIEVVVA